MAHGGRVAAALWARTDLRRRWRSLIALGVLAGLTAGLSMAALAGSRRTATALPRLKEETNAPAAIVFASQSGIFDPDFSKLRARPEVADLAVWDLVFGNVDGQPGGVLFASDDGRWAGEVNKPVVIEGRMWDPASSDEIVVDEVQAKLGTPLGSTVRFATVGPTIEDLVQNNLTGPTVTLKVVGVVREMREFVFTSTGQAFLPPGFVRRYRGQTTIHPNADVVLRAGGDVSTLRHDVNDIIGPSTPVLDLHAVERRVDTTLSVERTALLLLAVAVALAGGLLVMQALTRSAGTVGDDADVLRAMGMSRTDIATAAGLSHLLSAAAACAVAATTAIVASRWLPVGLGRRIDPDVGVHADWIVIGPALLLTFVLVLGGTLAVAARIGTNRISLERRASSLPSWIRRRTPLTIGLGTTLAFDRGRGRAAIPVRPALVGATVGVLGVVGALTINSGLNDALAHPERAGVTWDLTVTPPPDAFTADGLQPEIVGAINDVSGDTFAVVDRQLVAVNGVGVPAYAVHPVTGRGSTSISFEVIKGRAPRTIDEAVIGPATSRDVHANIGDVVQVGDAGAPVTIVGEALFPSDVHGEFDEGLWLVPDRLDQLAPTDESAHGRAIAIRLPHGATAAEATAALHRALPDGTEIDAAEVPVELANLGNVRTLPVVLAAFLALLAIGALSHALLTSVQRRRGDFAVLRAFGLTRRGMRAVLNSQGTAIGSVGLLIGIPLGIALGQTMWRHVTQRVPLADVPPFALLTVVLIVPATVLVANALAVWPGYRAVQQHPAHDLRVD